MKYAVIFALLVVSFLPAFAGLNETQSIVKDGNAFKITCQDATISTAGAEDILRNAICGGVPTQGEKFLLVHTTNYYSSCPSWGLMDALRQVKIKCTFDQEWQDYKIIDEDCRAEFHPNPFNTDCRERCEIRARCVN